MIFPSKILVTGKNRYLILIEERNNLLILSRIRINCCGMQDVINYDGGKNVVQYQREDIVSLGKLILSLACRQLQTQNLSKCLEYTSSRYGVDMKNLIILLLSKPTATNYPSINDAISVIAPRLLTEVEHLHK